MLCSKPCIRSKYYFNFILNTTRSGRELFDRPSYCKTLIFSHAPNFFEFRKQHKIAKLNTHEFFGFIFDFIVT